MNENINTVNEYEIQHFGFSVQQFIDERKHTFEFATIKPTTSTKCTLSTANSVFVISPKRKSKIHKS